MVEFLREWTLSLAGIIVFGSLCEMLLPGGVYKKYINLAVGLILCIALVSPFVKERPGIDFRIPEAEVVSDVEGNDEILAVYKDKLCRRIEDDVRRESGTVVKAECQVSDKAEDMGRIENIHIYADDVRDIDSIVINKIEEMYGTECVIVKDNLYGD